MYFYSNHRVCIYYKIFAWKLFSPYSNIWWPIFSLKRNFRSTIIWKYIFLSINKIMCFYICSWKYGFTIHCVQRVPTPFCKKHVMCFNAFFIFHVHTLLLNKLVLVWCRKHILSFQFMKYKCISIWNYWLDGKNHMNYKNKFSLTNSFIKEVECFRLFWPTIVVFCFCNNVVHCSWLQVFQRVCCSCWKLVFYLKVRYRNKNRLPISRGFIYNVVLWDRKSLIKEKFELNLIYL